MSKFSLAGLILINLQPNSFSKSFCLSISDSKFLSLCPLSSTSIANIYF